MREIKFRTWDNKEGEMHEVTSLLFERKGCWFHDYVAGEHNFVSFEDCVLEQYTGLLDKNGVEIYEGDIVLRDRFGYKSEIVFGKIGFDNDWNGLTGFAFKDSYDKDNDCYGIWWGSEPKDIEVIGNIHEGVKEA